MTPHDVRWWLQRFLNRADSEGADLIENHMIWMAADAMLAEAVMFEVETIGVDNAHVQFGLDLMEHGLFKLPFPICFFASRKHGGIGILCSQPEHVADSVDIVIFRGTEVFPGQRVTLPLMSCSAGVKDYAWKALLQDPYFEPIVFNDNMRKVNMGVEGLLKVVYHAVAGQVAMLSSREIEQKIIPAPAKLNKRRAEKGRLPIGERRIIRLRPGFVISGGGSKGDGSRASPRMHWRRGHMRRLADGRITPIPPMLINAAEGVEIRPKDYLVGE